MKYSWGLSSEQAPHSSMAWGGWGELESGFLSRLPPRGASNYSENKQAGINCGRSRTPFLLKHKMSYIAPPSINSHKPKLTINLITLIRLQKLSAD